MSPRVLFAEDDPTLRRIVTGLLREAGMQVVAVEDGALALEQFLAARSAGAPFAALLADINMPNLDGLSLIDRVHEHDPQLPVVFVTAYSSVESAVAALRKGAFDYLTKPFNNEHLLRTVQNALRQGELVAENTRLRRDVQLAYGLEALRERSPGLTDALRVVERAAPTDAAVLIRGETGTGKELFARAVHDASPRVAAPFLGINCAALPEGVVESELFGHVKGAFTGAVGASPGLFRAAEGGTLFLDEVGDMPPSLQAKLLRVLESREVRPVGATESVPIDVRIVAATHRDLLERSQAGEFREDLFYRLAVIELELPPLRDRPADVGRLAQHFLARLASERDEPVRQISPELRAALEAYPWPGNARELRNAIEHAATMGEATLTVADLPPRVRRVETPPAADLGDASLARLERRHVERVLRDVDGDRKAAAARLEIDLSTLYRKLKRWEAEDPLD